MPRPKTIPYITSDNAYRERHRLTTVNIDRDTRDLVTKIANALGKTQRETLHLLIYEGVKNFQTLGVKSAA